MLFWLVMAMQPRFMMTLDEKLEMLPVTVRVGQVGHLTMRNRSSILTQIHRLLMSWDRLESHEQSLVSKHISHQSD